MKTLGYERFKHFLEQVKTAQNDEEILLAGWNLMEEYQGFKFKRVAMSTLNQFKKIIEDGESDK